MYPTLFTEYVVECKDPNEIADSNSSILKDSSQYRVSKKYLRFTVKRNLNLY